jgi:hypothetical protein
LVERADWPANFLQWDERAARLDMRHGVSGFVPFSRVQRVMHRRAFLPVAQVIRVGDHIRLSSTLAEDRSFFGLVEPRLTAEFPFDRFVPIAQVGQFDFWISDQASSRMWSVSQIALAAHLAELRLDSEPRLEVERCQAEEQRRQMKVEEEQDRRYQESLRERYRAPQD